MRIFLLAAVVLAGFAAPAAAVTVEFLHVPSISSMEYRATGATGWTPALVNGAHGEFQTTASSVDVSIDGLFATHDLTGFYQGAFVTVVGKTPTEWAFNYDIYNAGDEVTRWLPVSAATSGVPEPSAALLAVSAIAGIGLFRRAR